MSVHFDPSAAVTQQQVAETPATSPRGVPGLSALSSISPSTAAPGGVSSVGMGNPQLAPAASSAPSVEIDAAGPVAPSNEGRSIDTGSDALRLIAQLEADEAFARDLEYRQATGQAPPDDVDPDVTEAYAQRDAVGLIAQTDADEAFANQLASEGPLLPEQYLFHPAIAAVTRGQVEETPATSPRGVPALSTLSSLSPPTAAPGGVSSVGMGYPQLAPAASSAPSLESQAAGLDPSDDDGELQRALLRISQLEADQAHGIDVESREDGGRDSSDDVFPPHLQAYLDARFAAELHNADRALYERLAAQSAADEALAIELHRESIPIPEECLHDERLAEIAQIEADRQLASRLAGEGASTRIFRG